MLEMLKSWQLHKTSLQRTFICFLKRQSNNILSRRPGRSLYAYKFDKGALSYLIMYTINSVMQGNYKWISSMALCYKVIA